MSDGKAKKITNDERKRFRAYVEVVHTNCGLLGYALPLGNTDFYMNWGCDQPGKKFKNINIQ